MWNVLIADDEPKIRQGLKIHWKPLTCPYVCAQRQKRIGGAGKAKEYEPDILLVDICMPKLSGIKFLEELKSFL